MDEMVEMVLLLLLLLLIILSLHVITIVIAIIIVSNDDYRYSLLLSMMSTINDDVDDIDGYDQDDAHDDDHDYDSRQSHSQFPSRLIHNAHSWFWNSLFNLRKTDQMRLVILDAIVGGEAVFF